MCSGYSFPSPARYVSLPASLLRRSVTLPSWIGKEVTRGKQVQGQEYLHEMPAIQGQEYLHEMPAIQGQEYLHEMPAIQGQEYLHEMLAIQGQEYLHEMPAIQGQEYLHEMPAIHEGDAAQVEGLGLDPSRSAGPTVVPPLLGNDCDFSLDPLRFSPFSPDF